MPIFADNQQRPDPDKLLKLVQAEDAASTRGKLKIFFGACAGVGKTYAMLSAGHDLLEDGVDVVIGLAETHGREETVKLLEGLPILPTRIVEHRGTKLKEFDLEAAIARKPAVLLLDELAHTNAPGSRHPKRWQDVEELLSVGIDVYTSLNVQHLESLNDVVTQITGIWVKETVPDTIFDKADEISLVDIPSEELLRRLNEGKVYIADQAKERAAENFFRKGNLIALRELALRRTAERVDAQMSLYKSHHGIKEGWTTSERVMVCIGPDMLSQRMVRAAKRMANSLKASWVAVYVENHRHYRLGKQQQDTVQKTMRLAEELGAKIEILQGANAVEEIIRYARENNISKIVAGKPHKSRLRNIIFGSLVDEILRKSENIDVYIIHESEDEAAPTKKAYAKPAPVPISQYIYAVFIVAICTLISLPFRNLLQPENLIMIYLVGVIMAASRLRRLSSLFASLLSVVAFNLIFIQPYYSLDYRDTEYLFTMVVLVLTALTINAQTSRLRLQALFAGRRERNTSALYAMTRELTATRGKMKSADVACRHINETFNGQATIWLPNVTGRLQPFCPAVTADAMTEDDIREESVARWTFSQKQLAGLGTTTLPSARGLYVPLISSNGILGVLGLIPNNPAEQTSFSAEQIILLETFCSQAASALERANVAEVAETSKVEAETEKLRSILLSSVSHDLRMPLAAITGATSVMLEHEKIPSETRDELLQSIHEETGRLDRIITNLLSVTNLESGNVTMNKDMYFIDEIIGSALLRLNKRLAKRQINTRISKDLPLVKIDGLLIEQVLVNLLENAARFTPPESTITISARVKEADLQVSIKDNGPGIPKGEEEKIFDQFYVPKKHARGRATGLGLAISKGIITAHGGRIWVEANPLGGAVFNFTLPLALELLPDSTVEIAHA